MAASMGEVSFPRLGARLPSAAVNSVILEAYVIPGYEKPIDQEEAILDFLKRRDAFVFLPTGTGKSLCFASLPSALLPFSSWKSTFDTRTGYYFQFRQLEARSYTWQRRKPKGYSLFACKKKNLPRCRNTQHSVTLPSCLYKFHTSLFPPVLRNQNWLPGPRKSAIVARPPFRAIAKWRPEVGWGRD